MPQKSGYTFVGWGLSTTASTVYASGAIVKNLTAVSKATVTLYALWRGSGSTPVPDVPEFPDEGGTYSLRSAETTETSYVKTYEYDLAGNRTRFALTKDGETVHNIVYHYDALNRLTALEQDGEIVAEYTYDVNGNRASLTYATGTVTTYTYNLANWVTGMTSVSGSAVLTDYSYTYYADGNRRSETDRVSNAVTTYVYDDLGRLVQESETDGLTISYTYDLSGNRTQMAVSGAENYTVEYTYDANNRLEQEKKTQGITTTTTLYTYDDNGNLLRKGTVDGAELYEYNGFNQLVIIKQGEGGAAYGYNASGIRVSKQVGDTYTYYLLDGGDVVAECTDDALSAIYLRGFNLIYRTTADGTDYYLHDAHGDVVALTDDFGAVTKRYSYDAFGNEENPDDSDTNPFRYCGEYFDKETRTYYLRARYYDPAIGRFTQQDPHWSPANMIYGDNPRKIYERQDALGLSTCTYAPEISAIMQSGNLYVYCVGNPILYCDPNGRRYTAVSAETTRLGLDDRVLSGGAGFVLLLILLVSVTSDNEAYIPSISYNGSSEIVDTNPELVVNFTVSDFTEEEMIEFLRPPLPSLKKVKIDMEHIMSGHSFGGKRGGPNKDRFPWWMTEPLIKKAIQEAYRNAEKLGELQYSWKDGVWTARQFFRGSWNGMDIYFWFNHTTKTIESGWPK